MESTSFLLFKLRGSRYAIEARAVCEIVALPEISPLDETPDYVVGVVNVRGRIVPIIDLDIRFGNVPQPYRLTDCVVLLEQAGSVVGMIVNEVQNVRSFGPEEREALPAYGAEAPADCRFLSGLLKSGEQVVMLLDLANLLQLSQNLDAELGMPERAAPLRSSAFCPGATPEERTVLRERACTLAQTLETEDQVGLMTVAVVRLGGELFAVALQSIREFAEFHSVTSVPCSPGHIVGLMNLRGDLVTVVDVSGVLGLTAARAHSECKVVVLNSADLGAGVLVDAVLDVFSMSSAERAVAIAAAPAAGREYLLGTAPYGPRMLSLLDLPLLLMQQNLIVNENP